MTAWATPVSAAQFANDERNLCGTASTPAACSMSVKPLSESGLPCLDGKMSPPFAMLAGGEIQDAEGHVRGRHDMGYCCRNHRISRHLPLGSR